MFSFRSWKHQAMKLGGSCHFTERNSNCGHYCAMFSFWLVRIWSCWFLGPPMNVSDEQIQHLNGRSVPSRETKPHTCAHIHTHAPREERSFRVVIGRTSLLLVQQISICLGCFEDWKCGLLRACAIGRGRDEQQPAGKLFRTRHKLGESIHSQLG